ncbi:amidohydrolase family protein [candidate division KSB1 bacterium]|nr:amidohydrolase family protein [candidate division KSB1 bacterium]
MKNITRSATDLVLCSIYPGGLVTCSVYWAADSAHPAHKAPYAASSAGMAVAYGLSKDEALKAVTLYPAQMYGVDDVMGSLEVGKMANIVVTNGDMLEPSTKVLYEFIRGEKVDLDDNYHYKLYMKYRSRIKK